MVLLKTTRDRIGQNQKNFGVWIVAGVGGPAAGLAGGQCAKRLAL